MRVTYGLGEGQMVVMWSGEGQVRVKSHKYSELDIGRRKTCDTLKMTWRVPGGMSVACSCHKSHYQLAECPPVSAPGSG